MKAKLENSELNFAFWFHLFITLLAWIGPFLFSWYWMLSAYIIVILQFIFFKRCLLNKSHGLDANRNEATFYSVLLNWVNYRHNPKRLKYWVRVWLYPILALFTLVYQLVFGFKPLIF